MNPENPLHWVAVLLAVALVILPSALALIGIYWHAAGVAEETNLEGTKTGKDIKP